jgi:hypothetical protein|tara:strand:+ start:1432 stop:2013 length:582 start_codon:yes stop_codon:yes gene_type:complete
MTAILKVDTIQDTSGNNIINESSDTITIGASGDTITIPAGATIANSGTATGFGGDNTPAFAATLSGTQSVSNGTQTTIVFNSEAYDTDSAYDVSNGRFTVPSGEGGKYLFTASLRFDQATSNRNGLDIMINGSSSSQSVAFEGTGAQYLTIGGSVSMNLSAGDYVSCLYYQTSGGSISVRTDSHFSGFKLIGV